MIDYTELFLPQTTKYFEENPEALYTKVFYMLRDIVTDEDEQQWMGAASVTILSMDFSRAEGIASSDATILDKYTLRQEMSNKIPNFVTQDYYNRYYPQ